jgi:hypothetical protein
MVTMQKQKQKVLHERHHDSVKVRSEHQHQQHEHQHRHAKAKATATVKSAVFHSHTHTAPKNIPAQKNNNLTMRSAPTTPSGYAQLGRMNRHSSTPSPKCFASSKCFEPPTPDSLPKPPVNWTVADTHTSFAAFAAALTACSPKRLEEEEILYEEQHTMDAAQHLKLLLKVQA